jgi:hypothetical protein
MRDWTAALTGPDGKLPLLNDAWEGPDVDLERPTARQTVLPESGYVVLRAGDDQLVIDAGPLSPPHLPPHAHADALSFVLWGDGRPAVVDPGTGAYTGADRNRFRGTRAHNTVEVDGRDQCQFWGDFRAAFLPTVTLGPVRAVAGATVVTASHDGYARLADPVTHQRTFVWLPGDGVVVVDRLLAREPHRVQSSIQASPGGVGDFEVVALGGHEVAAIDAAYSPYLGQEVPALRFEYEATIDPDEPFGWSMLRGGTARLEGRTLLVATASGDERRVTLS